MSEAERDPTEDAPDPAAEESAEASAEAAPDAGDADAEAAADDANDDDDAADDDGDDDDGGDRIEGGEEYTALVKVYNARDVAEARLVQSILESFHIPCAVEDEISPDIATLDGAHLNGVDIHVPEALQEEARLVLCERGVICPIDEDTLGGFLDRLSPATQDAEARAALVGDLSQEHGKELRRMVLAKLPAYPNGLETAIAMLGDATSIADETEGHIGTDLARLANRGAFGGAASPRFVGELSQLAASGEARQRRLAAEALGRLRDAGASAALLTLLEDDEEVVRDEAIESLYVLSRGESFGYDAAAALPEREKAVLAWREWQEQHPWA